MNWAKAYLAKETNLAGRRGSLTRCWRARMSSSVSPRAASSARRWSAPWRRTDRLRPCRAGARDLARRRARRRREGRRHWTLRLSEHDGRLARLPRSLSRAARLAGATSACAPCSMPLRRWPTSSIRTSSRRLRRAAHLRFPGRPGGGGRGRARRAGGRRGRSRDRAGAGQRAHPPLRLRGTPPPNRPPAASTRRFARRRSTSGCDTAVCWRFAPRSRSAITTS